MNDYSSTYISGKQVLFYLVLGLLIGIQSLPAQTDSLSYSRLIEEAKKSFEASDLPQAFTYADKSLNLATEMNEAGNMLASNLLLARITYRQKQLQNSLKYYLQTLNLRKEQDHGIISLPALHIEIAQLYESWSVYEKAFESFKSAQLATSKEELSTYQVHILSGMAKNKESSGEALESLRFYEQLLTLFREKQDVSAELETLRNIIRIQKENGFPQDALKTNLETLALNQQQKDSSQIIVSLNNIGVLHQQLGDYENALRYFSQAAEMEDTYQPTIGSNPITLSNIGIIHQNLGDYPSSLNSLLKAEFQARLAQKTDTSLWANISNLISIIYLNTNELNKAYFYNQQAIDLAKSITRSDLLQLCYKTRANIHEQAHDYEEALDFFRQHTLLKDSLSLKNRINREQGLERRFSAEQLEKEMSLLLVDKEIAELKLRQDQLENERLRQENELTDQQLQFAQQDLQRKEAEQALVLAQNKLLAEAKNREIALLQKEQSEKELLLTGEKLKNEQQEREIIQAAKEQAELDLALQEKDFQLQSQQERILRNSALGILLAVLMVLALVFRNTRLRRKANQVLSQQKQELEETLHVLKQTQTQLIQSEKMASLGALTAGVAHEINNPLNFVSSNAHALKLDLQEIQLLLDEVHKLKVSPDEKQVKKILAQIDALDTEFLNQEVQELVASIERGANRTKNIVLGLRTFSRSANDEFVWANIHEGLDSTLTILNSKIKDRIRVHKNYGNIPQIQCQFDKLNQVFMNILNNAIQAIEKEGDIYIESEKKEDQIYLSIRDTGAGIPEELRKRIFEPFFTTKPIGQGTGLGLSISYGIIEQHGGKIDLISESGVGTTFNIRLPIEQK